MPEAAPPLSVEAIAGGVARGELTAREVVAESLRRISAPPATLCVAASSIPASRQTTGTPKRQAERLVLTSNPSVTLR